jgi:hypothetical protein
MLTLATMWPPLVTVCQAPPPRSMIRDLLDEAVPSAWVFARGRRTPALHSLGIKLYLFVSFAFTRSAHHEAPKG